MKNPDSIHYMRDCLSRIHALSSALGYNNGTFLSSLERYDVDPGGVKDPYLKAIFDYLFKGAGPMKSSSSDSRAQFLVRYVVTYCFLSKVPHTTDAVKEALALDCIDGLTIVSKDLAEAIDAVSANVPTSYRVFPWQYKEAVLSVLQAFPNIRMLSLEKGGREESRYLAFTTDALRKSVRLGEYPRRLWQGIYEPVYFTFCFNLKYKDLCLELWIYDNVKGVQRWRNAMTELGQSFIGESDSMLNRLQVDKRTFLPDLTLLAEGLSEYLKDSLPDLETRVLRAYEIYKQKGNKR